jgi:quercetin dioxygenase-like cupin family protein
VMVCLVTKPKGTGARMHTHANEQFNYIIKGHLKYSIASVEGVAGPGELLFIPANAEHYTISTEEEDVVFYASKDTSFDISGEAVDGTRSGAYFSPGFERKGE